jgi:hypothetical protein
MRSAAKFLPHFWQDTNPSVEDVSRLLERCTSEVKCGENETLIVVDFFSGELVSFLMFMLLDRS